jgi:hypothetical protein
MNQISFECTTFGEFIGISFLILILASLLVNIIQQVLIMSNASMKSKIMIFKLSTLFVNIIIVFLFISFLVTLLTNACVPNDYYY